jgi:hypothetical protein
MAGTFSAESECWFAGEHDDVQVSVNSDKTVCVRESDGEGNMRLILTLSMTDLTNIHQFATRAIKAMEAAKTEVEGG